MGRYLGTVRITNSFVNFYPFYRLEYGELIGLTNEDRRSLFPSSEKLNINLYSLQKDKKDRTLLANEFDGNQLYFVDLKESSFELNENPYTGEINKTRYKLNLDNMSKDQYGTIDSFGYFYYLPKSETSKDFIKTFMTVDNSLIGKGFKVVVETDNPNYVAGPFNVSVRSDGEKVIVTHKKDGKDNDLHIVTSIVRSSNPNEIQEVNIDLDFSTTVQYKLFYKGKNEQSSFDVISDEDLLKEFKSTISNKLTNDGKLDLSKVSSVSETYNSSMYKKIPSSIVEARVERIKKILTDEKLLDENTNEICDLIAGIIVSQKDSTILGPVFEKLVENKDFMNAVPKIHSLETKISELENEVESKQQELNILDTQIINRKDAEREEQLNSQYSDLLTQIESAKNALHNLESEVNTLSSAKSKSEYLESLNKEIDSLEREKTRRTIEAETIEKNIDEIFSKRTEKALSLTFDGMISQKMIQAAAEWETEHQNRQYEKLVLSLADETRPLMNKNELVDYLYNNVKKYREGYDKNTIINMFVCLAQGFLTVFSGAPGAGKTSACNIIAHALGLTIPQHRLGTSFTFNCNRYIDVSVERGWTSKRDFIGYFNPLTKKFDRNNSRLFDALNILDIEAKGNKTNLPFIVLLDEANLSPMEYYWADFMNVCDDLNENSSIDLGEDYRFLIPNELRFLATINNDHTTESLSPRLIDRAWIIKLPSVMPGTGKTTIFDQNDNKEIRWSDFLDAFYSEEGEITGGAKEIYEVFLLKAKKIGIKISPRSDAAIRRYWKSASTVMEKDENDLVEPSVIALDYAISQKVLPQISGSGETMKNGLIELKNFSSEKNLSKSESVLEDIIARGNDTMMFYQYFG